jgi:hypothetical protein
MHQKSRIEEKMAEITTVVEVTVTEKLNPPAETVWPLIRALAALPGYSDRIDNCTIAGEDVSAIRTVEVPGIRVQERMDSLDDEAITITITYSIIGGALPTKNYHATQQIVADGDGCIINWTGRMEPNTVTEAETRQVAVDTYISGIESIQQALADLDQA